MSTVTKLYSASLSLQKIPLFHIEDTPKEAQVHLSLVATEKKGLVFSLLSQECVLTTDRLCVCVCVCVCGGGGGGGGWGMVVGG